MLQNASFFKTLLNGIKSKFQSQQKQISKHGARLDDQQAQIDDLENKMPDNLYIIRINENSDGSYETDKDIDDIVAAVRSDKVLIALYEDKERFVGDTSLQYTLYLDEFTSENFGYGDGYYIKLTAVSDIFNSLKRYGKQGTLGFDIVVNYESAGQRDIKKTVRYNTDIIYEMIKSSTDGRYHLYLNGNEVQPDAIALGSGKNCYIDDGDYRYFNAYGANGTTPVFYNLSRNGISSITINRRYNSIETVRADVPYYTLPIATSTTLGGVKPVAKTNVMTQDVGVDADGKLYTASSSGSNSFVIKVSEETDGALTVDKTRTEIFEAFENANQYDAIYATLFGRVFVPASNDRTIFAYSYPEILGISDAFNAIHSDILVLNYENDQPTAQIYDNNYSVLLPTAPTTSGVPYYNTESQGWEIKELEQLPTVTTSDNGKFLRVVNGAWAAVEVQNANGEEF